MTRPNERKNNEGKPEKSELLSTGDKADEIVEVLVAMFLSVTDAGDASKDGDSSQRGGKQKPRIRKGR